jgi:hypothetical protein
MMGSLRNDDLAPDGKRALGFGVSADATTLRPFTHVNFFLNFFSELRRRAPQGAQSGGQPSPPLSQDVPGSRASARGKSRLAGFLPDGRQSGSQGQQR